VTKIAIPKTAAELEDMLGNPDTMQSVFSDPSSFKTFIGNYAKATMSADASIANQIKEEVQMGLAQWLKDNPDAKPVQRLNLDPNAPVNTKGQGLYSKTAPGARIDAERILDSNRDFLSTIYHGNQSEDARGKRAKLDAVRNAFGSTVGSDGGFLIPESLRSELLRVALETAIVRPRARVVPMETLTVPFPTIDSTSHASNVYGGVTAAWTEESGTLTDTSPKFGRVKLEAKKLTAYSEVPNELFTDSIISLETFVDEVFPEAIAWFEDVAFIRGTGAGEPLGFLNADAAVSVTKESGQAADTIVWENIVKMYSRMLPTSLGRAVWIAHIDTFPELATMALSVGTGGSAIWLNSGSEGPPMTILGRPVIFTEKAETIGDAGDINFVDLGYYLLGDRQAIQASTSPHFKFQNDQTAIRFIERVDGRPWIQSAITPNKGTNTLTPFVKIAARA
jgi:HK97 family phage major capsid protein